MDKIVVEGGASLEGEIVVSGAKNATLPILASALLTRGTCRFMRVPQLNDVRTMGRLLRKLGCEVDGDEVLTITTPTIGDEGYEPFHVEAPYELVKTMRASVLVLGPLLARYGRARVSLPGGCAIGARPIDQHLKGLEAMGAEVTLEHGYITVTAEKLTGAHIVLDFPTVTGTENLMMAAALADGLTTLENAAREPEIEELAQVINKMGGRVEGAGTGVIQIHGVPALTAIEHSICPDRIEAGTFMVAAAITRGNLLIRGAIPEHLDAVIAKLRSSGATVSVEGDGIRVVGPDQLRPLDITTQPYPGFPTDMQAQFMVLAAISNGQSMIKEAIFENRFMHVSELARMGADIHVEGRVAIIRGVKKLSGATVMATDLRASASLILAGLVASGTTEVLRVYHLDRGYQRIERKLENVGANIKRVPA